MRRMRLRLRLGLSQEQCTLNYSAFPCGCDCGQGNIVIEMQQQQQQGVSWQSHLTMQIESSRDVDNNNNNKDNNNNNNNLQQKSVKCWAVLHSLPLLLPLLLVVSVNICQSADDPHQVGLLLLSPHRYAVRCGNLRLQKL